jgi:uncharacterized membrane protein YdjX (TVP38/TMEM64 family)
MLKGGMMVRMRLAAALLVILAAAWLGFALGGGASAAWAMLARQQAALHGFVAAHPLLAVCLYVALDASAAALCFPALAGITLLGGLLFGPALGTLLSVAGAGSGGTIAMLLARRALRPLLGPRTLTVIARLEPKLQRDGFSYVLALRLLPVLPSWLISLAAGIAGVRLLPFMAASCLGMLPATIVYSWVGSGLGDLLADGRQPVLSALWTPSLLLPLLALALLALAPIGWRQWRRRGRRRPATG